MKIRLKSTFHLFLIAIALFSLLASCVKASVGQGFDWPRWRGPDGNGISREAGWNPKALSGGPKMLWERYIGIGHSNISIKDNRLYAVGQYLDKNLVWCLNSSTGKIFWKYSFIETEPPQSTPSADGNSVYVLSKRGLLICLSAEDGKLQWKRDLVAEYGATKPHYGFAGSPVIEEDLLILTANTAGMALDRRTGRLIWTSDKPPDTFPSTSGSTTGTDYATPVVYGEQGKRYAVLSSWRGLSSVETGTGKQRWLYEWELYDDGLDADPVISGNLLLVAHARTPDFTGTSLLLDISDGKPSIKWKSADLFAYPSTPVILDGYIYALHGGPDPAPSAVLRCLELETGRVMWEKQLTVSAGPHMLSLIAADGKLIILNDRGNLFIAEASPVDYKELSRCDIFGGKKKPREFWTAPVLCNGKIYCRNYAGDLVCIDVHK